VSFAATALLGAFVGLTIFIGLPMARLRLLGTRGRVALAMFAVGVLVFLLVDVLSHAFGIVEAAVEGLREGTVGPGDAIGLTLLLTVGFALGSAGLATVEQRLRPASHGPPPAAGGSSEATVAARIETSRLEADDRARALRVGMTVAAAVGLHNFAEGLAIGVAAHAGEIALATVLMVGFALHNATEGFGIVGPLGGVRPSWRWLGLAGVVGGGPVLLGTMVGYWVSSEPLELAFYGLAAGAILYVIGEVWMGMRRLGHRELGLWLLSLGFVAGVLTDLVVGYGGG
jgi:ZIP family zinc transporter